jgi:hypothetical protein
MSKVILCSFADSRISPTLDRLKKQAVETGFFDEIFFYNENDFDKNFLNQNRKILKPTVRGYGYWIWKPYIIKKTLSSIDDEDILLYIDAGSYLNKNGKERFFEYINIVKKNESGLLTFELNGDAFKEKYWTKGDLFDYFNVRNNIEITNSLMRDASTFFLKKIHFLFHL